MRTHAAGSLNFFCPGANPLGTVVSIAFTHFARPSSELSGASRPPPAAGLGAVGRKASLNHRAFSKDFTR